VIKFSYKNSLVSSKEFKQRGKKLLPYIKRLQKKLKGPESSIFLPSDLKQIRTAIQAAKKYSSKKFNTIIVAGIGGSNLGTLAIWEALQGKCNAKMLFAETLDARHMQRILEHIKK